MPSTFTITTVDRRDAAAIAQVRALLQGYLEWLGPLVGTTTLGAEIDTLPDPYAAPGGALLLARDGSGAPAGCVGVREHTTSACEIKRLYVVPAYRGQGLGRALVRAGIDQARAMGYAEMYLTTLPGMMDHALAMYRSLGFTPTGAFRDFSAVPASVPMSYFRRPL